MDDYEDRFEKEYFDYWTDLEWAEETRRKLYRQELGNRPLRSLAQLWLEELGDAGLSEVDPTSPAPPKRGEEAYDPRLKAISGELYPVRLDESQRIVWLNLDGDRTNEGYRSIEILDKPLITDTAIIATLTVLEGSRVGPFRALPQAIVTHLETPREDKADKKSLQEVVEEIKRELSAESNLELLSRLESLEYPVTLLRERRPNFDNLPYEEQLALLKGTCDRIHGFSEALRKLVSFIEFGEFDPVKRQAKLPNRITQQADRYIRAAILRDVKHLSHPDIAKELKVPIPRTYSLEKDIEAVRDLYKEGRKIMERALGEGGWSKQVETMNSEIEWWESLNEDQKEADKIWSSRLPSSEEEARYLHENYKSLVEDVERISVGTYQGLVQKPKSKNIRGSSSSG